MGPISTMKLQDTPPSSEERERREGILNTIQESLGYLESGNRGPEWQMSYIYPPGLRAKIPLETQKLASTARRGIYKQIKKDIHSKILETERKVAEHVPTTHPRFDEYVRELATPYIQEYQHRIKAITSIPDSIIARARKTKLTTNKDTLGSWAEYMSPAGRDKGGALYLKLGRKQTGDTVQHEGGHMLTGVSRLARDASKNPNSEAGKIWKQLPKTSRETLENAALVDDFDRKYIKDSIFAKDRYNKHYKRWPGENFANEVSEIIPAQAGSLRRRLTTDEYLKAVHPAAKRAVKQANKLDLEFSENSQSRIRDFWSNIIGK